MISTYEKEVQESPQTFLNPEIKIVLPLIAKESAAQFVQRSLCVVIVFCFRLLSPERRRLPEWRR